ncbi:hypothetical protein HOD08_00405, partial [bacterium]|nr:hypothetical protein [bacterium]
TLFLDRNFTFTYSAIPIASASAGYKDGMSQLKFDAATSRLYLSGCEFRTSTTGAKLDTGYLVVEDKVTFSSGAHHDASAVKIDTGLSVEILKASTLDMYGYIEYAS